MEIEKGCVLQAIICVIPGLAALRQVLHVFGDVVHVGDVWPLLRVGVDAHIYQIPQLRARCGWFGEERKRNNGINEDRGHIFSPDFNGS